jgi:CubicO group peptidase (beta-lactamase class C family)
MKDTAFHVGGDRLDRFSPCYRFDPRARALVVYDDVADSAWRGEPPFESGAGGLVGTVDDYFAFYRMMLNKGRHGREQILSHAAVELMTSDQLAPAERAGAELFFGDFSSWGFGLAVDIARREIFHTPGRFGWTGGLGTTAYVDPAEGLIGILFTQRLMDSPAPPHVFSDFWTTAYAAME